MDATLIQASLVLYARLPLHVRHIRVNLRALECLNLLINRIFFRKKYRTFMPKEIESERKETKLRSNMRRTRRSEATATSTGNKLPKEESVFELFRFSSRITTMISAESILFMTRPPISTPTIKETTRLMILEIIMVQVYKCLLFFFTFRRRWSCRKCRQEQRASSAGLQRIWIQYICVGSDIAE